MYENPECVSVRDNEEPIPLHYSDFDTQHGAHAPGAGTSVNPPTRCGTTR